MSEEKKSDERCVFCDRSQFEERLCGETDDFWVIATLGQIIPGYVLLAPKSHIKCGGAFEQKLVLEMHQVAYKICSALTVEYKLKQFLKCVWPVTIFEHGGVGQSIKHAHFHFLPKIIDLTPRIQSDFPNSKIETLEYAGHLYDLYRDFPQPYLFWVSGKENDTKAKVCWNPPAPQQYLRLISAELVGHPERGNWRNMDPELDKKFWSETVRRLKPYF